MYSVPVYFIEVDSDTFHSQKKKFYQVVINT